MNSNIGRRHLSITAINLVAAEHNGNVTDHSADIGDPSSHRFVGALPSNIEHHDGRMGTDVIFITRPAKLHLSREIPHIEGRFASGGIE